MSLELLQSDWKVLLGAEGLRRATASFDAEKLPNILDGYAFDKGLTGSRRYLFSSVFECCGLRDSARFNMSPVLADTTRRAISAALKAEAPQGDADVLVALSPFGNFGAEVTRSEHGYLILVSPVTFSFCFLYAILAVTSAQATGLMLQERGPRDEMGKLLIDPFEWSYLSHCALGSVIQEFFETGTVFAPHEKVAAARFDLLPWQYIERIQSTYEQMLDFLVLHELGHVVLGHMRSVHTVRRIVPSTTISVDVASPLPSQEDHADDFALRCLVGVGNAEELVVLAGLLQERDPEKPELDKLWTGHTCIGRYTSTLQLLKLFERIDYHSALRSNATRLTDTCEINGTHPTGQHRFVHALGLGETLLKMPSDYVWNVGNIVSWSNWVTVDAANNSREGVRQVLEQIGHASKS